MGNISLGYLAVTVKKKKVLKTLKEGGTGKRYRSYLREL